MKICEMSDGEQIDEYHRIMSGLVDCIPVVVKYGDIEKKKMMKASTNVMVLMSILRRELKVSPNECIVLIIGNEKVLSGSSILSDIYTKHKINGFLFIELLKENVFG